MRKLILALTLTLYIGLNAQLEGNLYIDPTQQLLKKSVLSTKIQEFIEKRIESKLNDNEILASVKVCNCNCHDYKNIACPAYPDYLPLSLFIETNSDGSFKLNQNGTLKFKNQNDKVNIKLRERNELIKTTLYLKQLQNQPNLPLKEELQKLYQHFKKQNSTYAQMFENKFSTNLELAKLNSAANIYRNKK